MKQCKLKLAAVNAMDEGTAIKARLEQELDEAEKKAHANLARYRFHNFGYWAATWVHINWIGQFHRQNPFSGYVKSAAQKGGEIDAKAKLVEQTQGLAEGAG